MNEQVVNFVLSSFTIKLVPLRKKKNAAAKETKMFDRRFFFKNDDKSARVLFVMKKKNILLELRTSFGETEFFFNLSRMRALIGTTGPRYFRIESLANLGLNASQPIEIFSARVRHSCLTGDDDTRKLRKIREPLKLNIVAEASTFYRYVNNNNFKEI